MMKKCISKNRYIYERLKEFKLEKENYSQRSKCITRQMTEEEKIKYGCNK